MTTLPVEVMAEPAKHGYVQCDHCNGYGSSLNESAPVCSKCDGAGLVKSKTQNRQYKDCGISFTASDGSVGWICTLRPEHPGGHSAPDVGMGEAVATGIPAGTVLSVGEIIDQDGDIRGTFIAESTNTVRHAIANWCRVEWSSYDVSYLVDNEDYDDDDEDSEEEIEADPDDLDDDDVIRAFSESNDWHCEINRAEVLK